MDTPYGEGWAARENNLSYDANPYPVNTDYHEDWQDGWYDADYNLHDPGEYEDDIY